MAVTSAHAANPSARALLERAGKLHSDGDRAGALDAYMEAVRVDPDAADLGLIERFSGDEDSPRRIDAVRQYLTVRPGDWEGVKALAALVALPEAESLLEPFFKSRPGDPDVYALRGAARLRLRSYSGAVDDFTKASELDPRNAERHIEVGHAQYQIVEKGNLTEAEKRTRIRHGLAALRRAEELNPHAISALVYRGLLLRQQAALETDAETAAKLIAEAEATRTRGAAILQRRRHVQDVTSHSGTFAYSLPADWQKEGVNSYSGPTGRALEQIYPAAAITAEYCRAFGSASSETYRYTEVENRVYDNGHLQGCFAVQDLLNVPLNREWRHTSFRFATGKGVEDLTVVMPKEVFDAARVKSIVDSVRAKAP